MIAEGLIDGTGVTEKHTEMTDGQVSEGGFFQEFDVKEAYQAMEDTVVDTYQKIEDGALSGYKKIENSFVSGYRKIEEKFVQKFLARKGETTEEAKKRLSRK